METKLESLVAEYLDALEWYEEVMASSSLLLPPYDGTLIELFATRDRAVDDLDHALTRLLA